MQLQAIEACGAAQDIDMEKRSEVAYVAVVVDGRPTAIEAERVAVGGVEGLDLSGESIEELKGHARIKVPEDAWL
jgi:hypothetical protein